MGLASKWKAMRENIHTREAEQSQREQQITRHDLRRFGNRLEGRLPKQSTGNEGIMRMGRMLARGFGTAGKSLATPSTNRRPRIAQLPGSRREMGISSNMNLDRMKPRNMRGQGIKSRRLW